jgi:hypothetical protein
VGIVPACKVRQSQVKVISMSKLRLWQLTFLTKVKLGEMHELSQLRKITHKQVVVEVKRGFGGKRVTSQTDASKSTRCHTKHLQPTY